MEGRRTNEVVIDRGDVLANRVEIRWRGIARDCKEILHLLAGSLVDEFALGQENSLINNSPDVGARLMDSQDVLVEGSKLSPFNPIR